MDVVLLRVVVVVDGEGLLKLVMFVVLDLVEEVIVVLEWLVGGVCSFLFYE